MNQVIKHSFEAVSLLTTDNGMLEVTIIPAINQPDWLIPSSLILSVDEYAERISTYLWQQQELAIFHLLPREQQVDKIVVLEGNTVVHRFALQTAGELRQLKVRISDVKDTYLPEHYLDTATSDNADNKIKHDEANIYRANDSDKPTNQDTQQMRFKENVVMSYMFQAVTIDNISYLIPDLDKIAHQLIDLDG